VCRRRHETKEEIGEKREREDRSEKRGRGVRACVVLTSVAAWFTDQADSKMKKVMIDDVDPSSSTYATAEAELQAYIQAELQAIPGSFTGQVRSQSPFDYYAENAPGIWPGQHNDIEYYTLYGGVTKPNPDDTD